ncbi:39S ribosomal protein L24, mitochondrial [Trichoplax sp. H2]|nr:39S ribosomal protein L24, mitochondrial [Trichoplax sp. H2]|eukprot:RDD43758.1 39S ribosomal protein L24, mitochondrial [Trichoplax sp. H2]
MSTKVASNLLVKTGRLQRPITGPRRFRKVKPDLQIRNWKIVRGDSVEVLSGKDKGVVGKVSQVLRGQNKVFVEGLNCHYRYLKPHEEFQGGLVRSEAPLHYSKVALVDPSDGKGTKVGFMFTKDGEKVRVSRRTGTVIPKPPELKLTRIREAYIDGHKDTSAENATKVTYVMSKNSFESIIIKSLRSKKQEK